MHDAHSLPSVQQAAAHIAEWYDREPVEMLGAVGALAGFAAQQAVWSEMIEKQRRNPGDFLFFVDTPRDVHYLGNSRIMVLVGLPNSHATFYNTLVPITDDPDEFKDVTEIFSYFAAGLGHRDGERPRVTERYLPRQPPKLALDENWGPVRDIFTRQNHGLMQWPGLLGVVGRLIASANRDVLPPNIALRLALETAAMTAHINPRSVPAARHGLQPPMKNWTLRAMDVRQSDAIMAEIQPLIPHSLAPVPGTGIAGISPAQSIPTKPQRPVFGRKKPAW